MGNDAFKKNVKALRTDKGFTQNELAEAIGVTNVSVSSWETKGVKPKSAATIVNLCNVLDCTEQDLFGITDGYYARAYLNNGRSEIQAMKSNVKHVDGRSLYAPPELCSDGNFFMTMNDNSMGRVIPKDSSVLVDIYDTPKNGDVVLVSIDGEKPSLRKMNEIEEVYVFSADTWEDGHRKLIADMSNPDAPRMQILGVARYICKEL